MLKNMVESDRPHTTI